MKMHELFTIHMGIGFALMLAGGILRLMAFRTLGVNFSTQLIKPQRLVTFGVYKWVRHPMYLGSWMLVTGAALAFMSWEGRVLMFMFSSMYFDDRIEREEEILRSALGAVYVQYSERTVSGLPFPSFAGFRRLQGRAQLREQTCLGAKVTDISPGHETCC